MPSVFWASPTSVLVTYYSGTTATARIGPLYLNAPNSGGSMGMGIASIGTVSTTTQCSWTCSTISSTSSITPYYWHPAPCPARAADFVPAAQLALKNRREDYRKRSSIKRSLRLLSDFGMEPEARIFISGSGDFYVSHPDSRFKFKFTRNHCRILDFTLRPSYSTPYNLELWTKDEQFVSRLCVFVKDTPILDQILAISVFIRSGDEAHILEMANYFSRSDDHALLIDIGAEVPKLIDHLRHC